MKRTVAATLALLGALVLHGDAQPNQPIYLQYDGFVRNPEAKTITLSFGYWNLNHVDVKLDPGPDNGFVPGPADRQQPITLLEGRHRFACTIVVPENFTGPLQWQVKFAGKTQSSTEKVMNPLYELEVSSARKVMEGIDPKTAPKNLCANHAPTATVGGAGGGRGGGGGGGGAGAVPDVGDDTAVVAATPTYTVILNQDLTLPVQVTDDGLPRNSKIAVNWKKTSGPGEVTFTTPTTATTGVKFSAPGAYEVALLSTDGDLTTTTPVKVTVNPVGFTTATEKAPETYSKAMKDIQATQTALRGTIGAKNYDAVIQNAATLKASFSVAQQFWTEKDKQDAITAATNALKVADDLDAAARAKNDVKLIEVQTALGRTCAGCHAAHRQAMGGGVFEIK